eukprot:scaffold20491_cov35-Cyclotella_meneghiniana.AAC.4
MATEYPTKSTQSPALITSETSNLLQWQPREIIEQSRPCDQATRAVIKIQDRFNGSLKITTPIVDGAQVFQLDFTLDDQKQAPHLGTMPGIIGRQQWLA